MNKKITQFTQIVTSVIDRALDMIPIVDVSEVLPANRNKKISIQQLTGEYEVTGTLTSAELLTIGFTSGTPIVAIPAPGAGYYIRIIRCDAWLVFNTAAYAGAYSALVLKHNSSNKPLFGFNRILASTVDLGEMGVLQDTVLATDTLMKEDEAVEWTTFTGADPTTGDSDVKYRIRYAIEPVL